MKRLALFTLLFLLTQVYGRPYLQLEGGYPTIAGKQTMIDTALVKMSAGFAVPTTAHISLLGEIGVMTGVTYDAGQLGVYADDHLHLHLSAAPEGLAGASVRLGRLTFSALGGFKLDKLSTPSDAKQDTLSKLQPVAALRLGYLYNPNVRFTISVEHTFGGSGDVYRFNNMTAVVTLNHIPSQNTVLAGVQLAL